MTTQHANAIYQEVVDLHTEENTVSVIGIHTPSSRMPVTMLAGFWKQFNKFRYNGCSLSMIPAARLPTDPLHVDDNPGTGFIDPRDNLNPILFHGCHGNDMGTILNQFYETGNVASDNIVNFTLNADNRMKGLSGVVKLRASDGANISVEQTPSIEYNVMSTRPVGDVYLDTLYYRALTDTTWRKSSPQSGLKIRGLHPLVYDVATTRYLGNSGNTVNTYGNDNIGPYDGASRASNTGKTIASSPSASAGNPSLESEGAYEEYLKAGSVQGPQSTTSEGAVQYPSVPDTPFYTPRTRPLGWMDTRLRDDLGLGTINDLNGQFDHDAQRISGRFTADKENYSTVPKIFMGMLLLPRAYKQEQYFRIVLTHSFSFKGFRGQSMTTDYAGDVTSAPGYWNLN